MEQAAAPRSTQTKWDWSLQLLRLFTSVWSLAPAWVHFFLSRVMRFLCELPISRFYIPVYCQAQYPESYAYDRFSPASGGPTYRTFQDFFMRRLTQSVNAPDAILWPCDGVICEINRISAMSTVRIKGEMRDIREVFSARPQPIPGHYSFVNIFLHNRDYHRVHAPVSGMITRIEHIPGVLSILRPWAYPEHPSLPALTNERINVDIRDEKDELWYLSIVGGPGVSTIDLDPGTYVGRTLVAGEEIAAFAIGSTCCLAAPRSLQAKAGQTVQTGDRLRFGS